MSNKFKEINIKNCTYYFFDDMIKIKKVLIQIKSKYIKNDTKVSYLLYRIHDDQRP